jgi:hypothetical protein
MGYESFGLETWRCILIRCVSKFQKTNSDHSKRLCHHFRWPNRSRYSHDLQHYAYLHDDALILVDTWLKEVLE